MSLTIYVDAICPHCGRGDDDIGLNITHNLTALWRAVGCYDALYMNDGRPSRDILPALERALATLRSAPEGSYAELMPDNGWGTVESATKFLEDLIAAIARNKGGLVRVSA